MISTVRANWPGDEFGEPLLADSVYYAEIREEEVKDEKRMTCVWKDKLGF